MKLEFLIVFIFGVFIAKAQQINCIPLPSQYKMEAGTKSFISMPNFKSNVDLKKMLPENPLKLIGSSNNVSNIDLQFDDRIGEDYELIIRENEVRIIGNDKGVFYGLQTLNQLIENYNSVVPCMIITDTPRFTYRGMHLDVCRHFFTVAEVKQYIDLLARYKFNTFHWHLTEDQGWRIEIKKYPLLTQIGSVRNNTLIGRQKDAKGTGEYDNKIEKGFYTQAQIKDVVKYASDRKITIIPEIEMPGHSLAAIASYAYLGCTKKTVQVGNRWGVYDDVYCAGNDSTFIFIQNVLDEVLELFPSKYIHIGGDEVVKTNWEKCTKCQTRIKSENLKDEHELQSYFIQRIEKYLNSKSRNIIGWDEILEGGLAPNATVMSWRGEQGGIDAAKQNHTVIMTPGSHCYFDHRQAKNANEPLNIGGNTSYQKVYDYNPLPKTLASSQHQFVLGAQANLWTEYIEDWDKICYMVLPRMQALSEVLWCAEQNKHLAGFNERLFTDLKYWDSKNYNFRIPEPYGYVDTLSNTTRLKLKNGLTDYDLFYEVNGKNILYTEPIFISDEMYGKTINLFLKGRKGAKRQSVMYPIFVKK